MAAIKERLVLEDVFSGAFSRYIDLAKSGTASTRELNQAAKEAQKAAGAQASQLKVAAAASRVEAAQHRAAAAAARAQQMELKALTAQQRLEAAQAEASARAQARHNQELKKSAQSASMLGGRLQSLAAGYLSIRTALQAVRVSDEMAQIDARLKMMTGSAEAAAAAQRKIYDAAQRSRGVYAGMTDLVSKLGTLAPDAFGSTDELITFAEQLQKQMKLSGAAGQSASAAMIQLTQALASGVLRGDELNSVLEQTPMIAKTIADYMGLSTGQLRAVAAEGAVTADIVKNAMLASAAETNAAFEQMPLTWSDVWTRMQNTALNALDPVLDMINWTANHTEQLAPAVMGVATALAVYTSARAAATAADWLAVEANRALITAMLHNPLTLVAVGIGAVVAAIYRWTQAVGGLEIAWLIAKDLVLTTLDDWNIGFTTWLYATDDKMQQFGIRAYEVMAGVQNYVGAFKVGCLMLVEGLVNGVIGLINSMISGLNKIPGVSIQALDKLSISAAAKAEETARQAERAAYADSLRSAAGQLSARRAKQLDQMATGANLAHRYRQNEIRERQAAASASGALAAPAGVPTYDQLEGIAKDVKGVKKSVDMSKEDIRGLVDVASRRYVNQVNLTSQTPVITVNGQNTGSTAADRKALADAIKLVLLEQAAASALRTAVRL